MKKIMLSVMINITLLTGCTVQIADLTTGSTKHYNLNSGRLVKGPRITGEDIVPVILFPAGFPDIKTAIDNATNKNKCYVALSDMTITQLNHAFIFGSFGYRVEGTAIIDEGLPGCENTR